MRFLLLLCALTFPTDSTLARPNFSRYVLDVVHSAVGYTKTRYPHTSPCVRSFEDHTADQITNFYYERNPLTRDRIFQELLKSSLLRFKQCIVKLDVDNVDEVMKEFNDRLQFTEDYTENPELPQTKLTTK
ncbi:hypothetical protein BIW11_12628 [Tropilaelaps mercedesae]|uniref:Uncharacterized protein n=1 Tax=Tropilaelaps mercedesae TaxID=418985 RepID=A0A1V9X5U3_9ACAR|nr:hypothetical protein BIW11_12628 [Tropilaelaps mercedesae]